MPSSNSKVGFAYLPYATYADMDIDVNTIYYTSDTKQMFVGQEEYTRPVTSGTTLPATLLPPNSLFYHTEQMVLYLSKDGEEWTPVSNYYTHPEIVQNDTTSESTLAFGDTFDVETVTVDECGHVTGKNTLTLTLPTIEVVDGSDETVEGNAVTEITYEDGVITYVKGIKFVTYEEFEDTIGNITTFEFDADAEHGGEGYESLEDLKEKVPEGKDGVIYLVKSDEVDDEGHTIYYEYLWTGSDYVKFGTFGGIDFSQYVKSTTTINGHELTSDVELTKEDIGLGNVDNTADADKEVASAGKLTTPIDVELTGDATGKVEGWDGSENLTIETEVNHATSADTATEADHATSADSATEADHATSADTATNADNATTADSATKAEQDGDGNVISDMYATKEEMAENNLTWQVFD